MKEMFLIRHGRQDSKLCNVDVGLDDAGKRQATLVGKRLATYGISHIYTSKMLRAYETGKIISDILDIPVTQISDIEEIHFGGFTGKTDEQIRSLYGNFQAERRLHKEDLPFPVGGECGADVVKRVMPVLKKLCESDDERIAIVTHGGVIRSVCAHIVGAEQKNKLKFGIDLENCSISEIVYDYERDFFFLERFNDFAHLEGHDDLLRKNFKTSLERGL